MKTNLIVIVGMGEGNTIITGIISDGQPLCHIMMNKQQTLDHIAVLQRRVALLPDPSHNTSIN